MTLHSNVLLDEGTRQKLLENQLNTAELLLVSLANMLAGRFEDCEVHLGAVREDAQSPALFVEWSGMQMSRLLAGRKRHDLQFGVCYLPQDRASSIELGAAAQKLQEISKIPYGEGEIGCFGIKTELGDGLAKLTGQVLLYEEGSDDSPEIRSKELYV